MYPERAAECDKFFSFLEQCSEPARVSLLPCSKRNFLDLLSLQASNQHPRYANTLNMSKAAEEI